MGRMTKAREILDAALALSREERTELLAALSDSLAPEPLHDAWNPELFRRLEALESGEAEIVPGEVVDARVHALLDG